MKHFKNKTQVEPIEKSLSTDKRINMRIFLKLVQERFSLITNDEAREELWILKKAFFVLLSNKPSVCFLVEKLFEANGFQREEKILEKLTEKMYPNKLLFVLSAICREENTQRAAKYLSLIKQANCPYYVWIFLLVLNNLWKKALCLGRRLRINQAAEVYRLVSSLYFQLSYYKRAEKLFQYAVQLNRRFSDVWLMMSLTLLAYRDIKSADEALSKVRDTKETSLKYLRFLKQPLLSVTLLFSQMGRNLTSNSSRL